LLYSCIVPPLIPPFLPYTTLFRSDKAIDKAIDAGILERAQEELEKHLNVYVKSVVNASDWDQYEVEIRTAGDEEAEESEDAAERSEEHTSELQSRFDLVCRLLLEK